MVRLDDAHMSSALRRLGRERGVWGVVMHGSSTEQGSGGVCCG